MSYKNFLSKEYKEIYIIIALIITIRLFILEPFRIPSASMQPTLLIGDFIFVNKFIYGINIPIIKKKINVTHPKRGDLIVFKKSDKKHYIKRLIGIENDKIIYKNKKIYLNNVKIKKIIKGKEKNLKNNHSTTEIKIIKEYLNPKKEYVIKNNSNNTNQKYSYSNVIIPKNSYFLLGDNRDNSEDSRFWGFIKREQIKGKAIIIWFSIDKKKIDIRWNRILKYIK